MQQLNACFKPQAEHERMFSPSLPRAKAAAIAGLAIGCVDKVFIEFLPDGTRDAPDCNLGGSASHAGAAQHGCNGASNGAHTSSSNGHATVDDRAVVAYQLLWRSDAAALGPSANPPGAPSGDGAGASAPKLWDSASSHLSGGAAAEALPPALQGRLAAAGAADAPNSAAAASGAASLAAAQSGAAHDSAAECSAPADSGWMPVPGGDGTTYSSAGGGGGMPAWVRGVYSLRLWGPEFLSAPLHAKRNGYTAGATIEAAQKQGPALRAAESGGAGSGDAERPRVMDTAAALGTLNLEQDASSSPGDDLGRGGVPAEEGAGTPRRRGGANAEAYLDRSAGAAGAAGLAQAGCCAVMWLTGADAQAMEAAPDEEARPR